MTFCTRSIEGLAFAKYSSACLPPEGIVIFGDGTCMVRGFIEDLSSGVAIPLLGRSYSLLQADPAHDMWALGALLYRPLLGTQPSATLRDMLFQVPHRSRLHTLALRP